MGFSFRGLWITFLERLARSNATCPRHLLSCNCKRKKNRLLCLHVYGMFSDSHFASGWLILGSFPGRNERISLLTIQTNSGDNFSGYQAFPLVVKRLQREADY